MIDSLHELEEELRPRVDRILAHPFLNRLSEGRLTTDQLQEFSIEYFFYCNYFPRCLALVAGNTPDDDTRMPLIENLWEEHGSGSLQQSHRTLYHTFMLGLGVPRARWEGASPTQTTSEYLKSIDLLCRNSSFLVGLGALGPGTESFTSAEYALVLSGLERSGRASHEALAFWSVHIDADVGHYGAMAGVLRRWMTSKDCCEEVRKGALTAVDLEIRFWDGLDAAI